MAAPSRYDIEVYQGETWVMDMALTDENGAVRNLTGYTAAMSIRNLPNDPDVHISLTSTPAAGITITALSGLISVTMTAAQTAALAFSRAVYDLYIKAAGGTVTYLLTGEVTLIPHVTVVT